MDVAIDAFGGDRVAFFGNEALAIPTIALINVWRYVGYTALLIFAGLQTIPRSSTMRLRSTARPRTGCSGQSPSRSSDRCWRWYS